MRTLLALTTLATWHALPGSVAASSAGRRPCLNAPVRIVRAKGPPPEAMKLSLTRCDGSPNPRALRGLSVLARPGGTPPRPGPSRAIQRLSPELLTRLQRVATRFPGRDIEIVSGLRKRSSRGSRHRRGKALDIRVVGISNTTLRDFLRQLPQTGVGYYPHSTFVHMDAREQTAYWVDESGPGEPARYTFRSFGGQPAPQFGGQPAPQFGGQPAPQRAQAVEPRAAAPVSDASQVADPTSRVVAQASLLAAPTPAARPTAAPEQPAIRPAGPPSPAELQALCDRALFVMAEQLWGFPRTTTTDALPLRATAD